jgi:site-specific DNA-methyltransferase (adenine-specific)
MEIQIETSTNEKEIVLDMFGGSGTTAVAARNLGRKFVIIEQDLHNYKTIINRLKNT